MCRYLLLSVLLVSGASFADETPDPLASLRFLVGHCWQASFADGQRDIQCFEPMYGGKHIRNTHVVIGSNPRYEGTTIFSHDSASGRVRFHYFTSTGAVSTGELWPESDGYRIPERHVGSDGKLTELETRFRQDGEYGFLAQTREKTADGWTEKRLLRYRRDDAPEVPKESAAITLPNGEWRLVWSNNREGHWQIYRQEADGSQRNLAPGKHDLWAWSARGERLYALSHERTEQEARGWRAVGMDANGQSIARLSDDTTGDGFVDCHPSGSPCAVDAYVDKKRRIALFDREGRRIALLGDGTSEEADPQFSPDGRSLLFRSNRDGHWELWLGDAHGDQAKLLTFHPGNDAVDSHQYGGEGPARFSPDGRRIVWMRKFPDSGYDVWVMDADGSDAENLTAAHAGDDAYPSFSPDGKSIAFDSERDGNNEIYVMAADGSGVRRITMTPGADLAPIWVRLPKENAR